MKGIVLAYLVVGSIHAVEQATADQPLTSSSGFQRPWFCHDLDCPVYTVKETNDNFETREYAPSAWVATSSSFVNFTNTIRRDMFYRLFHYIAGNNSLHMKIPMTAPVVRQIDPCQGMNCKSNVMEHFMIPLNIQDNPPSPTENGVFIRRVSAMTVYVRSYGGYGTVALEQQNYNTLVQHLQAANKLFEQNRFYTAGYDGPYAFVRHNEIWIGAM